MSGCDLSALRTLRSFVGGKSEFPLPESGRSALSLLKKVLPGIFCYELGAVYGLAFPDVYMKPHMSMADTAMLRDICQILVAFNSRVAE